MSGVRTDKEIQLMLEQLVGKIDKAPALNGGFDRMMVIVEHIQEKQEETSEKINKMHSDLYEPDEGLYARVKSIETMTADTKKRMEEHFSKDEATAVEINDSLVKLQTADAAIAKDITEKNNSIDKIKKITGEDFKELETIIKFKKVRLDIISKISWLLIGGFVAAIVKSIWERIAAN